MREELRVHILRWGVLSPWDVGSSGAVHFSSPKQVVAPSEPNFWTHSLQIHCNGPGLKTEILQLAPSMGRLLVRWWVQWLVKAGSNSLGEAMVANLLCHKGRTARWFTAQQAFGTMCVALAPTRGQTPANLMAGPFGPLLRKAAAVWGTSRGLRGGTSSRGLVLVPFDPLERLNGALAMASPRKAEPRSCTVLRLKPMGKLITLEKYLSVRLN